MKQTKARNWEIGFDKAANSWCVAYVVDTYGTPEKAYLSDSEDLDKIKDFIRTLLAEQRQEVFDAGVAVASRSLEKLLTEDSPQKE
jgi:hypothetical protein